MKRMILLFAMVVLAVGAAFGHGKGPHVMGTVTAMTDSSKQKPRTPSLSIRCPRQNTKKVVQRLR